MKKWIMYIVTSFLVLHSLVFVTNAAVLHEVLEERQLMGGVVYQHIHRLESFGWQDIHVVRADMNAPGVEFEILKSKDGESFLKNTYQMAVENDALAALNADFFAAKRGESGRGSAVGVEIRDGELKTSASVTESMNTLYNFKDDNTFFVDAFQFQITVTATNGKSDTIKVINKYDDLTGIVMYTDDWGTHSVGSVGGSIEVSVDENGNVLEKVTESEPLQIPKGGYVLASHLSYNTFLLDNVEVGDAISFDIQSTPDYKNIESAVGGGGVLVYEGRAQTKFSHNISGRNPRSAVGIDETGKVLTLVVVDGRRTNAKGMTQAELAVLMQELGCYTALNLDGGGSTLMAIDQQGEKVVVNQPSDGAYRNVTNSIGIISTAVDSAPIETIKIDSPDNVFEGTSVELKVAGVDMYNRDVSIENGTLVTYDINGGGKVTNGIFYPINTGVYRVHATYGELYAEKDITVLSAPRELNFSDDRVTLKTGETIFSVLMGKDAEGKKAQINLSDTIVSVQGDAVSVQGNDIVAKKTGASVVSAKFGEVTANMVVMVDDAEEIALPKNVTVPDIQNIHKELTSPGSFRFCVFGNTNDIRTIFDMYLMNNALYAMKNAGEFQVILGANVNTALTLKALENPMFTGAYQSTQRGENTFITLPNTGGNIYTGDTSVWTKFQNDMENSQNNVFIFMNKEGVSDREAERNAFYKSVNKAAAAGKNVYVFGSGSQDYNTVDTGVRFINTTGILPDVTVDKTRLSDIGYVLVTVNGTDVTYEYQTITGE